MLKSRIQRFVKAYITLNTEDTLLTDNYKKKDSHEEFNNNILYIISNLDKQQE